MGRTFSTKLFLCWSLARHHGPGDCQLWAAPPGLRASLAAARHGCSAVAGRQPPPSLQPTGIIVPASNPAPCPMGTCKEEGWQLTFQLLCPGEQTHRSPAGRLGDRHISLGLQSCHAAHPLSLRLRHATPFCSNIAHTWNSAAHIPCCAHSKTCGASEKRKQQSESYWQ